jgi:acyl-CoA thioesterase
MSHHVEYRVVSPRVGVPGEVFTPASEQDAQRLVNGGFIVAVAVVAAEEVSTEKPAPRRKVKTAPKE